MSRKAVQEFLDRHPKIGLDTSIFIFKVEENPKYLDLVNPVFSWLIDSDGQAVTSTITMLELLVQPYRLRDERRAGSFYVLLSTYPHLQWIAPTLKIADSAARLRGQHNLSAMDAIQAATALASGAQGFVSNDTAFRRVGQLDVLILEDLA